MALQYAKLKGKIVEKYGSMSNFSDELGVKIQVTSRKLNGHVGFTKQDIIKWCELLDISVEEIGPYFFA